MICRYSIKILHFLFAKFQNKLNNKCQIITCSLFSSTIFFRALLVREGGYPATVSLSIHRRRKTKRRRKDFDWRKSQNKCGLNFLHSIATAFSQKFVPIISGFVLNFKILNWFYFPNSILWYNDTSSWAWGG